MWWLTLVIPATWEVAIGRIVVCGQPRQKDSETLSQPIIAGPGGAQLSYQLHRKLK
jgi:hypothetical protein